MCFVYDVFQILRAPSPRVKRKATFCVDILFFFKVIFLFVSRPANIIFLVHTYGKIKNGISHTCVLRVLSYPLNLVMVRRRKVCKSLSKNTLYRCSSDWKRQTVYFLLHSDSANFLCQSAA